MNYDNSNKPIEVEPMELEAITEPLEVEVTSINPKGETEEFIVTENQETLLTDYDEVGFRNFCSWYYPVNAVLIMSGTAAIVGAIYTGIAIATNDPIVLGISSQLSIVTAMMAGWCALEENKIKKACPEYFPQFGHKKDNSAGNQKVLK